MRFSWRNVARIVGIAGIGLGGCRDSSVEARPTPSTRRAITPRVIVTRDGPSTAILTIALDVGPDVPKIASFTGRLHFDPAALRCGSEVVLADSTARASNCVGDVIRVAGISTTGVDVTHLASFHFQVLRPAGLETTRFEIEELHDVVRTDARTLLRPTKSTP